jgi:hypothetical protein
MDRTVYPSPTSQSLIRRIDYRIGTYPRDIPLQNLNRLAIKIEFHTDHPF